MAGILMTSERLLKKISDSLAGKDHCVYDPTCILHNPNTGYEVRPKVIQSFSIQQNFSGDIMDSMSMTVLVDLKERMDIQKNMQDMECTLTLHPMHSIYHMSLPDQMPIIIKAKVFVGEQDQVDIAQTTNINRFGNTDGDEITPESTDQAAVHFPVTLNMYEEEAYKLRQTKMNAVFKDASLEGIIHFISERADVEKISMVPLDNKEKYNNVILPPAKDIREMLPFLQQRYGCYSKGLGFYYTQKVLYIYPLFDTNQETSPVDEVIHLINAPEEYFLGLTTYHNVMENDIYICAATKTEIQPLETAGTENNGNVAVAMKADQVVDNSVKLEEGGKLVRNPEISVLARQNEAPDVAQTTQNMNYTGETSNQYNATSILESTNGAMLSTGWPRAEPRLLKPGQTVLYHYDAKGGVYKTRKGRLQGVGYSGIAQDSKLLKPWLVFNASLVVRLEPELKTGDMTQQLGR